jgi:hypothetical protein
MNGDGNWLRAPLRHEFVGEYGFDSAEYAARQALRDPMGRVAHTAALL